MSTERPIIDHVASTSPDFAAERLADMRALFPDAFAEGKVDLVKLRALLGEAVDTRPERYTFTWAGKRDAMRLLQEAGRGTLVPMPGQSIHWDRTKNLFIEGDNLEVLKLVRRAYDQRVKLIYIDPPYNTGNDFIYPDDYSQPLDAYLRLTGQRSQDGRAMTTESERAGRFHSAWLSMMYPRMMLARSLLRDDGAIWISIDDTEMANLRSLCNEIFGEENFVATFIWQKRTTRENRRVFSFDHDYLVCFARNKESFQRERNFLPMSEEVLARYKNPDDDPRGPWQSVSLNVQSGHATEDQFYKVTTPSGRIVGFDRGDTRAWSITKPRFLELLADKRVTFGNDGDNVPREKVFLSEARQGLTPHTLWTAEEVGTNDEAKKAVTELFPEGGVDTITPKPLALLERIIDISTKEGDIIVDFFAGTASTAAALLRKELSEAKKRHFLLVQVPEPTPEGSAAKRNGFSTIADVGRERLRREIQRLVDRAQTEVLMESQDLGFRVFKLAASHIKQIPDLDPSRTTQDQYIDQMKLMVDPLIDGWTPEGLVWEVAIREGYPLTSKIERLRIPDLSVWRVTSDVDGQTFCICLNSKITLDQLKPMGLTKDDLFIARDTALDDTAQANLALQCRLKTL
jgi:adenine-specific DNA-methyltransferase